MRNRKFKITVVSGILVFVLLCVCILIRASDTVVQTIAALFGSIILFYMGGNVGAGFAVARGGEKK